MADSTFQAGFAVVDVTPPVGTRMGGFGGRTHGAVGIHDPLRAKAIAISDGPNAVVILTCDILSFPYDFIDQVTGIIGTRCGLTPDAVLINCSHTHSGPLMRGVNGLGTANETYAANLVDELAGAAEMAISDMLPVVITSHRGPLQAGINRRQRLADGETKLGRAPDRIVDKHVDVLKFTDHDGQLRGMLFAHATHGVVLGGDNYYFSADWMGYAQRQLEKIYPDTLVAFAQGCCGNINSDPVGGTFEDARRIGTRAAGGVMMAAESKGIELVPRISYGKISAHVPQQDPPPLKQAEERFRKCREQLREAEAMDDPGPLQRAQGQYEWARFLHELSVADIKDQHLRFDISAMALGQHVLVGLAGEVFIEYAVNISGRSPFDRTTVLGTTNGCICYLPTSEEIPFGGYEVDSSMCYYKQLWLAPQCEQVVLEETGKLLERLLPYPARGPA